MENTEEIDRSDMARLAAGHDAALNALMERHSGPVYQFLFRMLRNEDDANDLAQETFVRVYRYRARYDGGKFTTWLYTIAGNLARSEYRRRERHPGVSLDSSATPEGKSLGETIPTAAAGPAEAAFAAEQQLIVREAVARLPGDLREAVVLCEWEEMSVADAAAVLGATKKAVEARLYRARQKLREQLGKYL